MPNQSGGSFTVISTSQSFGMFCGETTIKRTISTNLGAFLHLKFQKLHCRSNEVPNLFQPDCPYSPSSFFSCCSDE